MANILKRMANSIMGKQFSHGEVVTVSGMKKNPPKRGSAQTIKAYSEMPWLRATTNKISTSVSSVNWKIYVVRRGGKAIRDVRFSKSTYQQRQKLLKSYQKQSELQEITDHPVLSVLSHGNDYFIGPLNLKLAQTYLELVGEAFLLKERNALNVVVSLWPIPPTWVKNIPKPGAEYFEVDVGGKTTTIPMSEIVWIVDPDPANPYGRGSGPAQAIADELETDEFAAKHTKSWFYNRARPDVIVSANGLQKDSTERLEEAWLDKHQGFFKAFKPFFIGHDIKVHELNQSFQSMQLIDLRKYERDMIHQFWGLPPEMLGITESSNRATIETADYIFAQHVTTPRLELLRTAFQERLVNEVDDRLILDFDSPVQEDKEHKLNVYKAAPWAFTLNQWQELAGDGMLDNGDIYMIPFSSSPVSQDDFLNGKTTNELPIPEKSVNKTVCGCGDPACDHVPEPGKMIDEPNEKQLEDELTVQEKQIIEAVVIAVKYVSINDRVEPLFRQTLNAFGESQAELLGTNWVPEDPQINVYLNQRIGEEITNISDTTKREIRTTLIQGFAAGESARDLEVRVRNVFKRARRSRARAIARTESTVAANFGALSAMRQATIEEKMWISVRDSEVRESHRPGVGLDGQVVRINDNFVSPVTGATGPFPGNMSTAADSVNCRCAIISVKHERFFMSEDQKKAYWRSFESERIPKERAIINAARDGFTEQEESTITALRGKINE